MDDSTAVPSDLGAYTKGPWKLCAEGDYTDFHSQSQIVIGDDRRVAAVHVSDDETRANARLISLAPDLVEALRLLLDTEQMDDDEPPLVEARKVARAVLSKLK